jgi:hypothetical protein
MPFLLLFILFIAVLSTVMIVQSQSRRFPIPFTQKPVSKSVHQTHILGGFGISTPEEATRAATDGVDVAFRYGDPPSEGDILGQKLASLHMKVVDGYISSYLQYYECHRTKTVKPPPQGRSQFCQNDAYPNLTNENALLATITTHLKQMRDNQLIVGYWVLDDWASWDAGSARPILIKIHQLIQQYTPGRPEICGFGAFLSSDQAVGWNDWVAANFSPQGCDDVGFYIYAPQQSQADPIQAPDSYDWSMSDVLPAMFTSLQRRGWDIAKEPLIGIVQAFGGSIVDTDRYWVTPNANTIETQSASFCEHGATGLTFYSWDGSQSGSLNQTPMNNPEIETGIRNGIAACEQYWRDQT